MEKTTLEKIDYLFKKINWGASAMDDEAITIMNSLKKDILEDQKQIIQQAHAQIIIYESSEAYENGVPISDLFENGILHPQGIEPLHI